MIEPMVFGNFFEDVIFVDNEKHAGMQALALHFDNALSMTLHEIMTPTFWLAIAGIAMAWYFYMGNPVVPIRLRRRFRFLHRLLVEQYYLDKLYEMSICERHLWLGNVLWKKIDETLIDDWIISRFFVKGTKKLGRVVFKVVDVVMIDGVLVNGGSKMVGWIASIVRQLPVGLSVPLRFCHDYRPVVPAVLVCSHQFEIKV